MFLFGGIDVAEMLGGDSVPFRRRWPCCVASVVYVIGGVLRKGAVGWKLLSIPISHFLSLLFLLLFSIAWYLRCHFCLFVVFVSLSLLFFSFLWFLGASFPFPFACLSLF